ncbi:uncharacterized protein LOC120359866 [Solenopsis invicta]|uniref:uncharacterized protein LOC120359866 n=1 Tax=Solenopsis invicta TaxID=13686 RepID=UPI00193E8641|nr:uncharacterized protein LOC120359866 [Solenopsis invicta]
MVAIRGRGPEERWASGTGQSTRAIRNPPPRLCARTRLFLGVVAYSPRQSSPPLSQSSIRRSRTVAAESRRCVLHCAFLVSAGAAAAAAASEAARSRRRARCYSRVLQPDSEQLEGQ